MELLNKYQEWRKTKNGSIFGLAFGVALAYLSFSWAVETGSILYYIFGFFFVFDAIASAINLTRLDKNGKVKTEVKTKSKSPAVKATSTPKKVTAKKSPAKKTNAKKRKSTKTS